MFVKPIYAESRTAEDLNQIMKERYEIEEYNEEYIGEFTITFYCGCEKCNGKWFGCPATNNEPLEDDYTIAVDTSVIPINTYVYVDGFGIRKACDTGSAIIGNRIDIYVSNHEECLRLGKIENVKVWKWKKGEIYVTEKIK